MDTPRLSAWQAARQSYALFLGALPRFSIMLLKMLAAFLMANGLVLTFFYDPPGDGQGGPGANLDLLALLLMAPFLAACGRLALLGAGAGEGYFAKVFRGRETRFLVALLTALIGGLAPIGLAVWGMFALAGGGARPDPAMAVVLLGVLLLGLLLSVQLFFRIMIWSLAAAIDKRPPFRAAVSLGGRVVWRACAASALVSGPFLILNILLGALAFVWTDGEPARLLDKRFLFCMETASNMLQALHLGLMTMACALVAKGTIPEIFDGDPPPKPAPGQTP